MRSAERCGNLGLIWQRVKMKVFAYVLVGMALAGAAQAQVYKCAGPNGTTVFADAPCAAGAKPLDVRPAAGRYVEPTQVEQASPVESPPPAAAPSLQKRADTAARRRGLQNEIDFQERRIGAKTDEMNAKLDELRTRKQRAYNNLAGATWEQSISQEMNAVAASYDSEIKGMRDELARLRSERDRLVE